MKKVKCLKCDRWIKHDPLKRLCAFCHRDNQYMLDTYDEHPESELAEQNAHRQMVSFWNPAAVAQ